MKGQVVDILPIMQNSSTDACPVVLSLTAQNAADAARK